MKKIWSQNKKILMYLGECRIRGVSKNNSEWNIPIDAIINYALGKRINRTIEDDIFDIVKVLYGNWFIDERFLCISYADFQDRVSNLKSLEWVGEFHKPNDGITSTGLTLSPKGLAAAK